MSPLKPIMLPPVDVSALEKPAVANAVRTLQDQPAKWLPIILNDRCTACGDCLEVCGPACLAKGQGPVLLSRPELCLSAEDCVKVCADGAIRMAWVILTGEQSVGRWRGTTDTSVFKTRTCKPPAP